MEKKNVTKSEIRNLATTENAIAWGASSEKWIFCQSLLETELDLDLPASEAKTDRMIDILENALELVLEFHQRRIAQAK